MKKRAAVLLSLLLLLVLITTGCSTGTSDALNLRIIHMNDHHSHLDNESYDMTIDGISTRVRIGGFSKAVALIKELKNLSSDKANERYPLTLHAGDALSGTLYYTLFKGQADADMMNLANFDAFTLGNHEFDDGDANLANFLSKLNTSVVNSNAVPSNASPLYGKYAPYVVKEFDGKKVGIIGLVVSSKTKNSSSPSSNITFTDELTTVQKYIDELTAKGINKIVVLSHYGYENDAKLAKSLKGVDVIVGGDSHTLLGNYGYLGLTSSGAYPLQTTDAEGKPVCVAQAWQYSWAVGNLSVDFNSSGVVTKCEGSSVILLEDSFQRKNSSGTYVEITGNERQKVYDILNSNNGAKIVKDDSTAASKLITYSSQVEKMKNEIIGKASEDLLHNRVPGVTYNGVNLPLGSDIAPLVSKGFYELSLRADACIQNGGGVRVSVYKGDITINTAYTLLPFANTLFEIDMTGSEIKAVLEDALDSTLSGSSGSFPYSYGLRYDIDTTKAKNSRIYNLEIKNRKTGVWSAIDNSKMYVIVTNSYTAQGKDGYTTFKTVQDQRGLGVDTYLDYAMSFVNYTKSLTATGKTLSKLPSEEHCIKSYK